MKKFAAFLLMSVASSLASAQVVYEDYEEYYRTLAGRVFDENVSASFDGVKNNLILWRGQKLRLASSILFPGEIAINHRLDTFAMAYERPGLTCFEGQASSSSGTAVRHVSVYLLDSRTTNCQLIYKLPSLFASCLMIRMDSDGNLLFHSASLQYPESGDVPSGVVLAEYVIKGRQFISTGRATTLQFVEPDNVWKFTVKSVDQ